MGGRKREVDRGKAQSNGVVAVPVHAAPRDMRALARVVIGLALWKHDQQARKEAGDA